jgi:hypothetical protein
VEKGMGECQIGAMGGRKNTTICALEKDGPRISAIAFHDWIRRKMEFSEQCVLMVQTDGILLHVYIKIRDPGILQDVIAQNNGALTYGHHEG